MPLPSLTVSPPIADPATTHWLHELQDSLALIDAEIWDQERSDHPGAKHRIVDLRICADDRRRQIAALVDR